MCHGKAKYLEFALTIFDSPKTLEGYTPSNLCLYVSEYIFLNLNCWNILSAEDKNY